MYFLPSQKISYQKLEAFSVYSAIKNRFPK